MAVAPTPAVGMRVLIKRTPHIVSLMELYI